MTRLSSIVSAVVLLAGTAVLATARQDQPLSVSKGSTADRDLLKQVAVVESASLEAPHAIGVSREYAAASLSVPIRPVRVLYGVWRN